MKSNLFLRTLAILLLCLWSSAKASTVEEDELIVKTRILIVDEKYAEAEKILTNALDEQITDNDFKVKIYSNLVMLYVISNNFDKAFYYGNLLKNLADNSKDKLDDAYSNYCFARIYLANKFPEKTIYFANVALKILEKYPAENYLKSELYRIISRSYVMQGENIESYRDYILKQIYYIDKTNLDLDKNISYTDAVVMYSSIYQNSKNPADIEKAFEYAEKSLNLVNAKDTKYQSNQAKANAYNNFASLIGSFPYRDYSKEQRHNIAKNYLDQAMAIASAKKFRSTEIVCYTTYAELCSDNPCKIDNLEKAYNLSIEENPKKTDNIKLYIINTLKELYTENKNYEKALKYSEESLNLTNISNDNLNNNRKKLVDAYSDLEQKKLQINQLTTTNKTNNIQKFLFLGMLIFALVGLVFMFYTFRYRQKLSKQNTNILQAEIKESELILRLEKEEKSRLKAEQDLLSLQQEQLQKQALAVSIQLNHKNSFIKELKEQLKNTDVNIDKILRSERITENDFTEIKDVLQEVHPNFFKKLNSISKTKLSNLDQKYAAYIYINMDNQKISNLLNVDPHTVRVTKYRLKQKLGLDKTQDLQLFLQNLI
ncbi:hypothetical protein [Soonwooa sp.]|uniref:helix-turn-helix transcriptional regulator n=1 Tax=Soonwooa sp. TaxID=1938592 RepID=UPI0026178C1E|nr:hypothetical protein [Soonwooa sp.]